VKKTTLVAATIGMVMTLAAPAFAQEGVPQNCDDFPNQEAAQEFLQMDRSDPQGLDADSDGEACETLPTAQNLSEGNGFSRWDRDQVQAARSASASASSASSASASASATASPVAAAADQYGASASPSEATPSLPATGGASLIALLGGALLIGAGLIARRIIR
jgi:LPXTG-motif cell wall-anchored protein